LQQRLVKTGGQLVKHARYYWLLLAEKRTPRLHLSQPELVVRMSSARPPRRKAKL
jgi:hypothetical protein